MRNPAILLFYVCLFVLCFFTYTKVKGIDQPAHSRSLMGALAIRWLYSIPKNSNFKMVARPCG